LRSPVGSSVPRVVAKDLRLGWRFGFGSQILAPRFALRIIGWLACRSPTAGASAPRNAASGRFGLNRQSLNTAAAREGILQKEHRSYDAYSPSSCRFNWCDLRLTEEKFLRETRVGLNHPNPSERAERMLLLASGRVLGCSRTWRGTFGNHCGCSECLRAACPGVKKRPSHRRQKPWPP